MATQRKAQSPPTSEASPYSSSTSTSSSKMQTQRLTHTTPLASSSILITLLGFTIAMITLPLGTYFLTIDKVFTGNATAAGAVAALMANLVLVAYVYLAWREDQAEQRQSARLQDDKSSAADIRSAADSVKQSSKQQ